MIPQIVIAIAIGLLMPLQAEAAKMEIVTSWIMRHSNQISRSTAKKIVEEAFKVPNPILIISLMEVESLFNPGAVSRVGAVGLGQVRYEMHQKMLLEIGITSRRDLFDITLNVKASSLILQDMIRRSKGNLTKALHLYLGGRDSKYVARIYANYVKLSLEIENAKAQEEDK